MRHAGPAVGMTPLGPKPFTGPDSRNEAVGFTGTEQRKTSPLGRIEERCFPCKAVWRSPNTEKPHVCRALRGTATGIRTRVSGLRIRRPSPLDDSGGEGGEDRNCPPVCRLKFGGVGGGLEGVEPPRPCGHGDLNAARLPVPPQPHAGTKSSG